MLIGALGTMLLLVDAVLSLNDADSDVGGEADGDADNRKRLSSDCRTALASRSAIARLIASAGKAEAHIRDRKFPAAVDAVSSFLRSVLPVKAH